MGRLTRLGFESHREPHADFDESVDELNEAVDIDGKIALFWRAYDLIEQGQVEQLRLSVVVVERSGYQCDSASLTFPPGRATVGFVHEASMPFRSREYEHSGFLDDTRHRRSGRMSLDRRRPVTGRSARRELVGTGPGIRVTR